MPNRITLENAIVTGRADKSYWDASSSDQIEGFATDFSVNAGQTVSFKINVNGIASDTIPYQIEIFRLGYYGGSGAREVWETVNSDGTVQPSPLFNESLGLVDAGNWTVTDSWQIPADAVSGVYLARVQRLDANGNPIEGATNQIPFIVRNDGVAADIVLQTSDTTWQAYNGWAGNNGQVGPNFYGDPANMVDHPDVADPGLGAQDRAYAVSYNRPFLTRDGGGAAAGAQDYLFGADYAAISWLEENGYDVSYVSGVDTDRLGADYLLNYKAFISVGHDEYWSGDQRANVEAARDAGVNLLFWSGNEVYWKTRWEDAISADGTAYRTLISYKETWANGDPNAGPADYANIDPSNEWTGTWRDMRFFGNPGATGQIPENNLTGQLFGPDGTGEFGGALDVPQNYADLRYWRDTSVAAENGAVDLAAGLIGYEWNVVPEDQYRPAGLIRLSETTLNWSGILVDQGNRVEPGTATHSLSLYRAESGALVFGSGTVFWSWGLSDEHDNAPYSASIENAALKQFTVNLFADMGIQPASLEAGLTAATGSTDHTPASITINDVADEVGARSSVTITGTATDIDGNPATTDGAVALVELSFDGGATWKVASGTINWSYVWRPTVEGSYTIKARAIDDSLNVYNATADQEAVTVTAPEPPSGNSLFDRQSSVSASTFNDGQAIELGMRFSVDRAGDVTQLRYYRSNSDSGDTDTREGHLWRASDGALLGTVTFTSAPGESEWQIATLSNPIALLPGVEYVVSYRTADNYVASNGFFAAAHEVTFDGVDDNAFTDPFSVISAPENTVDKGNGLYSYGSVAMPTNTFGSANYWVDITFDPADGTSNTPPVITSGNFTAAENQTTAGTVIATDSDGSPLLYGIAGGADANLFNINSTTGVLTFKSAPNYEAPADAGADNVYNVTVNATDNLSPPVTHSTSVTVTDVDETGPGTPSGSILFDQTPTNFVSGSSDATNYELGTKFVASQDGTITALRYYRGAADSDDTDIRPLRLWDASGNLLGTVEVTSGPNQTGWQVGTLTTPIAITAGQTYVASYGYVFNNGQGNVESYAASPNYFTVSDPGPDNILTAPASGAPSGGSSGGVGNGLFAAGNPGSFPTQSFNASNYWVDVVFQAAGTGGDNLPPEFTSSAVFNAPENQTAIGLVTATDPNSNPLTFSIVGGADAGLFTIGATNGRLELKNPQDFEGPGNSFEVILGVSDGTNPAVTQAVTVNLTDVDETVNGPAAFSGHLLTAQYIFGSTPTTLYPGAGASQTATVGNGVEFATLPSAGQDVGNGNFGLASIDARAQTVRIEFPLDANVFAGQTFVKLAGAAEGKAFNGVQLTDAGALPVIRGVTIIGQEGFTTSTGELQALTESDLTITPDGIFLNMANKGRLVDIDADTPGAQAAWVELLVDLNDAPVLATALVDQAATEDAPFTFTVPADAFRDDDGDTLAYAATGPGGTPLPGWLSFNAVTRTFSGTPANGDVGTLSVTVTASDGFAGGSVSESFDIGVAQANTNNPPVLAAAIVDQAATEDAAFTFTVPGDAFRDDDGDTLSYTATRADGAPLPAWLSFNAATRTFSGTPANGDVGTLGVTVTASDGSPGGSISDSFDIAVGRLNGAPTEITLSGDSVSENAPAAIIGTLTTEDPDTGDSFTYEVNDGRFEVVTDEAGIASLKLKAGQSLDYETANSVTLDIKSTDSDGLSTQKNFTINVLNVAENQSHVMTTAAFTAPSDDNWTVTGTNAADTINTLGGNDTVSGRGGDDSISTGDGDDRILFSGSTNGFDAIDGGEGSDTVRASAGNTVIGLRSLAGVEFVSNGGFSGVSISGSAAGDTLDFTNVQLTGITRIAGGSGDDVITGSANADTIQGNLGNDTLGGGAGDDIFQVGASGGVDSYDGGSETDRIIATAKNAVIGISSISNVEIISSGGFTGVSIAGSAAGDTLDFTNVQLTGITRISAGSGDDVITGSASADTIVGGAGDDTLGSGAGADIFQVGPNSGVDSYDGGSESDTIIAMAKNVAIGIRSLSNVEIISNGGLTGVTIAGSAAGDTLDFTNVQLTGITRIAGGAGDDVITGSAIADTIQGNLGNDTLGGGAGADIFQVGPNSGVDSYDGGSESDSIIATAKNMAIGISGISNVETISSGGFAGVTIAGSAAGDTLDFTNVQLNGIGRISGGAGDDVIGGNSAANTIAGDAGKDTLTGNVGADRFVYVKTSDSSIGAEDVLQDFLAGSDKIDVSGIDAKTSTGVNDAFTFIGDRTGQPSFVSSAGQLWTELGSDGSTRVFGDVDGVNGADFAIILGNQQTLAGTDFFL